MITGFHKYVLTLVDSSQDLQMPLLLISETLLGILFDSHIYILYDHNLIKGFIDIYKLIVKIELTFYKSKFKTFLIAGDVFQTFSDLMHDLAFT